MKLNRKKVHWIIRHKQMGVGTKESARDLKISRRRVQQIWKCFKETGKEPSLGQKVGRPRKPHVKREAEIVREAHSRYKFGARMLERVIGKRYIVRISHNRERMHLKAEGFHSATSSQKSFSLMNANLKKCIRRFAGKALSDRRVHPRRLIGPSRRS